MRCPAPAPTDKVGLKHGGGGPAMRALIERVFVRGSQTPAAASADATAGVGLEAMDDGAAIPVGDRFLVVTTDSHVVKPIRFPGGDIGVLAASGTINDLSMMGTTDFVGLTCAVLLEEGFAIAELEVVWESLRRTCLDAGVPILAGDTKVMGRGELDGIAITTTGVGWAPRLLRDNALAPGDQLIVNGTLGDHGLAVLVARHDLAIDGDLRSDVAPLSDLVRRVLAAGGDGVVTMKDPTRGGLVSALSELAHKSGVGIVLSEDRLPLRPEVLAASELLGIDPLHVANEGKAVIGVRPQQADAVLHALRCHPLGRAASIIGEAVASRPGSVVLETGFGRRLLTELDGEPLPRIC